MKTLALPSQTSRQPLADVVTATGCGSDIVGEMRARARAFAEPLLAGEAATVDTVAAALEEQLLQFGMAAADTALLAQDGFAAKIEHARYLTAHDLAAMMTMQYDHQGLAPLWNLVEAALLDAAEALDTLAQLFEQRFFED